MQKNRVRLSSNSARTAGMRRSGCGASILCALWIAACASAGPPGPAELRDLHAQFQTQRPLSIDEFLQRVASDGPDEFTRLTAARRLAGASLSETETVALYRLLGVYARTRYQSEMLAALAELIAIPTYRRDRIAPHENPAIRAAGRALERQARALGLTFENAGNRIFVVRLRGQTPEELGVYAHVDVVPALAESWGLPDGRPLQPFRMTVLDGKIYGRGAEDDKGSIVAAMYSMFVIRESGLPLKRGIRLMIETTEETGGEGIHWYKERYALPAYNIGLDSSYPAVTAEKGFGALRVRFRAPRASDNSAHSPSSGAARLVRLQGAQAINQIPAAALAEIETSDPAALAEQARRVADEVLEDLPDDFSVELRTSPGRVLLTTRGVSAHSSVPEQGANPAPVLARIVSRLAAQTPFADSAWLAAARFVSETFGLDYLGRALGVAFSDPFMGPLTLAVTQFQTDANGAVEVGVNTRLPTGRTPAELEAQLSARFTAYRAQSGADFSWTFEQAAPLFRSPRGAWIQTLLDIYGGVSGKRAEPIASSGATTARELPNGINFGPSHPGQKYMGHTDNEFKSLDNFLFDVQVFTEMMLRLGNLPAME